MTIELAATPQERIAKGVALLDQVSPGWEGKIDPAALMMEECGLCILGQVFGNYLYSTHTLAPPGDQPHDFARAHGFTLDDGEKFTFSNLGNLWRQELSRRPNVGALLSPEDRERLEKLAADRAEARDDDPYEYDRDEEEIEEGEDE